MGSPRNPYNDALEKAPGAIDHPHVATATFVYQLPFGAGHMLNSGSKVVSAALSNWQLSGIFLFTSGSPLVIGGTCTSGGILGTCYPNYNPSFNGSVWINGDIWQRRQERDLDSLSGQDGLCGSRALHGGEHRPLCFIRAVSLRTMPT